MRKGRVTIIVGSGISIPAGIKSLKDITEIILCKEMLQKHIVSMKHYSGEIFDYAGIGTEITSLFGILKREIESSDCLCKQVHLSYEDIYYVLTQIHDNLAGAYGNPAILPLIHRVLSAMGSNNPMDRLHKIVDAAKKCIRVVVNNVLQEQIKSLDYLSFFKDVCIDDAIGNINIFTLNHDLLLESYLSRNNIIFTDGFGENKGGIRYWKPELFNNTCAKVSLYKLHGSVDWFWFNSPNSLSATTLGKVDRTLINSIYQSNSLSMAWGPEFLVGTFNKMFEYISRIYLELHYHFFQALQHTDNLIIIGYGFGDKGINARIIDWIYASPENRLLLVHPEPENLKDSLVGQIKHDWEKVNNAGRLIIMPRGVEGAVWKKVRQLLV